jgi:hypothetical protein
MRRLLDEDPRNAEVIFPYVGGEDVNGKPDHRPDRFVINFGEREEVECRTRWPALLAVVEARVKPERMSNKRDIRRKYWWRFGETTPALFAVLAPLDRTLAICRHQPHWAVASLPAFAVFAESLVVVPLDTYAAFCGLQSRPHETWARFFGSSMKDDLRYTPSDCFEAFPFPPEWTANQSLQAAGKTYHEFRADLMIHNDEGLTKTYNRFHDPYEHDPDIERLRELHTAMDRAVLHAYGWDDIPTETEFLLDYEIDEEEWGNKKKPYRLRWPDPVRDEVLARLILLNAERAAEEGRSGAGTDVPKKPPRRSPRKPAAAGMQELG